MEEHHVNTSAGQGFGIAALVLGIVALLTALIPCVGILALIPGILGIIFAIVALAQASKGHGSKALIITALVISVLATSVSTAWVLLVSSPASIMKPGFHNISRQFKMLQEELENLEEEFDNIDTTGDYQITIEKSIHVTSGDKEKLLEELEEGDTLATEQDTLPGDK